MLRTFRRPAMIAIALLWLVAVRPSAPLAAQPAPDGDDPVLLRELAERLLSGSGGSGRVVAVAVLGGDPADLPPPAARLYPGRLPPGVTFAIPLPPNARLLGSYTRTEFDFIEAFEIVLDVSASPDFILSFYESALAGDGWTPAGDPFAVRLILRGGFVDAEMEGRIAMAVRPETNRRAFCPAVGSRRPLLSVTVLGPVRGARDVRIRGELPSDLECPRPLSPGPSPLGFEEVELPRLPGPPGVSIRRGASGGGGNRVTSEATAQTGQSAGDLEAHFAALLTAAGWTRRGGGVETNLAWSTWAIPDRPDWTAWLTVTTLPGRDIRFLRLEAWTEARRGPRD